MLTLRQIPRSDVRPKRWYRALTVVAGGIAILIATAAWAQRAVTEVNTLVPTDHPAIDYLNQDTDDLAKQLQRKLESGEVTLDYEAGQLGYLSSLLENLGVNPDSQILVFSKTSFQSPKIGPKTPRAIYFSDDVSVGYVQNGDVLEIAALDPEQGYVFYTIRNVHAASEGTKPTIDRRDVCLQCHHGPGSSGIPGIMVASVYPDAMGVPYARLGMPVTDHRTQFQERWGGWYVTGTHGGMLHRGNAVSKNRDRPGELESRDALNQTDLVKKFRTDDYLEPTSDLIALMVLEHQTRMSNLITRVGWEQRIYEADLGKNPAEDEALKVRIDTDLENLVTYMLFADESKILAPVAGASTFTETFPQRGPRDHQGRSLRDFDLTESIFLYPLSYMIYSDAFDNMPTAVRDRIYARLYEVLSGADQAEKFAKLTAEDRRNVVEIVRETKDNLPEYWQ